MARNTPPLHAKGVYTLLTPWTGVSDSLYKCIAIREFADFTARGESVFDRFYAPKGLVLADYEEDLAADAHIITLVSDTAPTIYVPDTYITKFPDLTGVEYKRIVLSVLLGPLPDTVDLIHLKASIASEASDITGVDAEVTEHVVPHAGVVTADQHATLEAARQAAITNRTTDRATVISQQATIDAQATRISQLEDLITALQNP